MRKPTKRVGVGVSAALVALSLVCSACKAETSTPELSLEEARANNDSRLVAEHFRQPIRVLHDKSGLESVAMFFDSSDTMIIAEDSPAAQLRGASLAISQHAPMLTYDKSLHRDIISMVENLGVKRAVTIGDVSIASTDGEYLVFKDPMTEKSLGELTAFDYDTRVVGDKNEAVRAVAALEPQERIELVPGWGSDQEVDELSEREESAKVPALPAQSRRDGQMAPVIVATPNTSLVSVANARSYGGNVKVLDSGNPTDSKESFKQVVGLGQGPLIALGEDFVSSRELTARIADAEEKFAKAH